jgi:hypothetical protein
MLKDKIAKIIIIIKKRIKNDSGQSWLTHKTCDPSHETEITSYEVN